MNNKNIIIVVLIIVILIAGYWWYAKGNSGTTNQIENSNTNTNATGTPDNSQVSGKINIDAVCQGALAYMTFPDGAAADKFVADCKEGKYPEVIEKYKADMNLGAGASI